MTNRNLPETEKPILRSRTSLITKLKDELVDHPELSLYLNDQMEQLHPELTVSSRNPDGPDYSERLELLYYELRAGLFNEVMISVLDSLRPNRD